MNMCKLIKQIIIQKETKRMPLLNLANLKTMTFNHFRISKMKQNPIIVIKIQINVSNWQT